MKCFFQTYRFHKGLKLHGTPIHLLSSGMVYLLILSHLCFAQTYFFKNYSVDEGLPFTQVYTIYQDSKGYLWSGGYGGLSKFNGLSFENYTPKDGLPNHWILSICEDQKGNIWAGTINGLSVLKDGKFTTYTSKNGLAGNYIKSIYCDSKNRIWIGTRNGLNQLDSIGSNGQIFLKNYTVANGLSSNFINDIEEGLNGEIWIATDKGLNKFSGEQCIQYTVKDGLRSNTVTVLTTDSAKNLWIGTEAGLSKYDGNTITSYFPGSTVPYYGNSIKALVSGRNNELWIATDKGLHKLKNETIKTYTIDKGILSNNIGYLYMDDESNLWIGTFSGLYKYRSDAFSSLSQNDGLNNGFIFQILRDSKGVTWICSYGGGIYLKKGENISSLTVKDGLPSNNVWSVFEDKKGMMWIGTDAGMCKYDGKTFTTFTKKNGLASDSVVTILQEENGTMWIGCGNGSVTKFNPEKLTIGSENFSNHTLSPTNKEALTNHIFKDNKQHLWFSIYQGGLFMYDGNTFIDYAKKLNLPSESYLSTLQDQEGNYYFGTLEGVYIYFPNSPKDKDSIFQISEANGLSSDLVWLMSFAKNNKELWIGTNQGISKLELEPFKKNRKIILHNYGKEEGFIGVECNANGAFMENDGTLWFATVNGVMMYNPNEYFANNSLSKTNITGFKLFYKDTVLRNNTVFPYDLNSISFEFNGICLTNPKKVFYKYFLQGFDKVWSPVTQSNIARYSYLPAGKYTFKVISCNNEGIWNNHPATFTFKIKSPFWKTWWFWTIVTIMTCSLLLLFIRYRFRQIKAKEQAHLHQKIKLATNELKALRAQMNPHFIFNALNSIQNFIVSRDEISASKYLNKFAKLIRTILNNSEKPTATLKEEIDALKLYIEMELLRFEDKFEYVFDIDPAIDMEYYEIPTLLLQPYVENAIIHGLVAKTTKGKLEIKITIENSYVVCSITDNGIGRKKSMAMKENQGRKDHQSMAMKITKDRLELINSTSNSTLSVKITDMEDIAEKNSGTKVEIYIPVE